MRTILIVLSLLLTTQSYSQSIEKEIAKHAIDLAGDDFSHFDKYIEGKEIIILGEAGHQGGATSQYKIKVVEYLIKNHGFNVIALENGDFLTHTLYSDNNKKLGAIECYTPWIISNEECRPLIDIVNNREVEIFGFDIYSNEHFYANLNKILNHLRIDTEDVNFELIKNCFYRNPSISKEEMRKSIDSVYDELNKIRYALQEKRDKVSSRQDIYYCELGLQAIKNLRTEYQCSYYRVGQFEDFAFSAYESIKELSSRDIQMADNIIWYKKRNPDKKIIVWCANFHGAKDISRATYKKENPTHYTKLMLMGECLFEEYGNKLYSIAFTYLKGFSSMVNSVDVSIEREIDERGVKTAYIDFVSLKYKKRFKNRKFYTNMLGYKEGYWMDIFDGVFYFEEEFSATPLNTEK